MSLFDDSLLNVEDLSKEWDRAESLVRRAQRAADALDLPLHFTTDDMGVKITGTAWRNVPDRDADRMVRRLEDLADARRRGA